MITALDDAKEVQPAVFLTVKVYDPVAKPDKFVVVPVPVVVVPPGVDVIVHVPEDGNPLKAILPVETLHVGCTIVPTTGAEGVTGWTLITTFPDEGEVHPVALVTV